LIADVPHGSNGVATQLAAQVADVDLDDVRVTVELVPPDGVDQRLFGDDAMAVLKWQP